MKLDRLTEATMLALRGKLSEVKGSSKTYTCIEDRQGGDFAVGKTMTAEEWGEEAYSWAYGDDWTDPEEPLLKNFKTEKECLDFIQDMWEITIVPSDSPEAKEFLSEARSHKEDNERVAPRNREQSFNGGPNKLSNKASGLAIGDKEKTNTGISKALVGPEKGEIVDRDIKRNRVRSAEQALSRKNAGQLDFAGMDDMLSYEVSPNQKSREYRKAHGMITRENKEVIEARSHKEDNERVAPRTSFEKGCGYVKNSPYKDDIDVPKRAIFRKGEPDKFDAVWGRYDADELDTYTKSTDDIEQYKKHKADAEENRAEADMYNKWAKQSDDMASNIVRNKKLARAQGMLKGKEVSKKESKKVTEATTDVNKIYDDYKKAYGKDLDLKTVPCVIARDKMLSGWGGAEGKTHYQVVLCDDSTEAQNIAYKMQAVAKREQLSNVRVSFGVKLPSRASVAYCVGRYASAWNTGDSWYERYDKKEEGKKDRESTSKKKTEAIDENLKAYTVTVSDEENQHSFQFYVEKDKTLDEVFNEIYDYVIF